jgi:serine phosphatase RsbU (regulator of sigma subunit)
VPSLSILSGADEGTEFPFAGMIVVGRGGTSDFVIDDSSVSRRHALIAFENGAWVVRDLGSANGTFVNDRRVPAEAPLAGGDTLRLGSVLLRFSDAPSDEHVLRDTTAIRVGPADALQPQVVLRMDAAPGALDTANPETMTFASHLSLIAETFNRMNALLFDERALLMFAVEELLKMLPQAERAFVMLWDPELERFVPAAARTRSGPVGEVAFSQTLLREVLDRKEAVLVADTIADRKYAQSESIFALKMRTAVCAPVLFQAEMFGVIQVDSTAAAWSFGRREVALTLALASQMAMALAYARVHARLVERELLERDLALARKIQHHFLPPSPPEMAGFAFGVEYAPAQAVGGDLYDFVPLGQGRLAAAVGDVSGKGIAAALFAAKVMSDIRHHAGQVEQASAMLQRLNETLAARDHEGMFVTLALAVIDPAQKRVTIASAGHPLPIVRDASGRVTPIGRAGDAPLGVSPDSRFRQFEYEIDAGDAVLLYTDGVIEALNGANELYGQERLSQAFAGGAADAAGLVGGIASSVRRFSGSTPQSDDVTIVCFTRNAD